MMADPPILPGARVRNDEELLGTIERLEPPAGGESTQGYFVVRAMDGERRYRLPLRLVHRVGEEGEQSVLYTVVHLQGASRDLARYLVDDHARREPDDADQVLRLPLAAEHLVGATRPVMRGTIHLHKGVQTTEQILTIPLEDEEVTVERIPADQFDLSSPPLPDETIIPITEERLVVETRRVITEYIRVRKRRTTRHEEVRGLVRREVISVSERREHGAPVDQRPLVREL